MTKSIRQFGLALLIVMTVSVAALGVHLASHESADLQSCELCSGQGKPAHAIPPSTAQVTPLQRVCIVCAPEFFVDVPAARTHAQHRAPPTTI